MPSLQNCWNLKSAARYACSQSEGRGTWSSLFLKGKNSSRACDKSSPATNFWHCSWSSSTTFSPSSLDSATRSSKVVSAFSQGNGLTASEALSRMLAIPLVYGPAWQSCGYHYETTPLRQSLECRIGAASLTWKSRRETDLRFEAKSYPPWCLDSKSKVSALSRVVWKGGDCWREYRSENRIGKQLERKAPRISVRFNLSGIGEYGAYVQHKNPFDKWSACLRITSQLHHLLKGYTASHFFRSGPVLPVGGEFSEKKVEDASCRSAVLVAQRLVFDGSHDGDSADGGQKQTDMDFNNLGLRLLSGAYCLPHPAKEKTGGEDAHFICSDEQVIGVADGVGGWADLGIDAGEYARELMSQSMIAVRQEPHGFIDLARVLKIAHSKTTCKGSSTACILALLNNGLQAINLGDSGFIVVRSGRTVFKSDVQQHQFNLPFQLENGGSDPPSVAEVVSLQVEAGDVIVAGTDGLFDNLYDNELSSVVMHSIQAGVSPEVMAQKIASLARSRSQDRNRQTPFSTAALDAGFLFYGGKMDDITVIVSYIKSSQFVQ